MKKSKYQQYFHCLHTSSICILVYLLVEYSNYSNKCRIQRCGTYQREALISIRISKYAGLIRGQHLFEARWLLEEIQRFKNKLLFVHVIVFIIFSFCFQPLLQTFSIFVFTRSVSQGVLLLLSIKTSNDFKLNKKQQVKCDRIFYCYNLIVGFSDISSLVLYPDFMSILHFLLIQTNPELIYQPGNSNLKWTLKLAKVITLINANGVSEEMK